MVGTSPVMLVDAGETKGSLLLTLLYAGQTFEVPRSR